MVVRPFGSYRGNVRGGVRLKVAPSQTLGTGMSKSTTTNGSHVCVWFRRLLTVERLKVSERRHRLSDICGTIFRA